jgi:hypothetical protein
LEFLLALEHGMCAGCDDAAGDDAANFAFGVDADNRYDLLHSHGNLSEKSKPERQRIALIDNFALYPPTPVQPAMLGCIAGKIAICAAVSNIPSSVGSDSMCGTQSLGIHALRLGIAR